MNKFKQIWWDTRGSFWFTPSLIVAFSIAGALGLIEIDSAGNRDWMTDWPRMFGASAEGARGMLSTIAGSMMTVVGVTFSIILVTLALASSQYTSRILRNFMGDRVTQVVLGIFAGIFTFCLIVLRTIRGGDESAFVPSLSVAVSVLLAIGGIATLIFFIHHIAGSIQASNIIASVSNETLNSIDRLFPGKLGENSESEDEEQAVDRLLDRKWHAIPAPRTGYIQSLDHEALIQVANDQHTIVRMEHGIGDFVVAGAPVVSLAIDQPAGNNVIADLHDAYGIGRYRTVEQDSGFGIRQLVDISLRALSPGINDTTTAVTCVDYLTAILSSLATKNIPSSHRYSEGELRVIAIGPTFGSLVAESFEEIRGSSEGNLSIMLKMLGALDTIGISTNSIVRKRILCLHAQWIAETAEQSLKFQRDRKRFDERFTQVIQSLQAERGA